MDAQQVPLHPGRKVDSDRTHVAHDLAGGLLEREIQHPFAAPAGGQREMRRQAALASACRARHQHAAAAVIPRPPQHGVQAFDAGGNTLAADLMLQPQRGDRQHGDAVPVDQERVFVGAVGRAPVLEYAQAAGGHHARHAVVEHDHTIGDILFQPLARQCTGLVAPLASDDGGDSPVLEPAEKAAQFCAHDDQVGQAGEQRFDRVEHHAFGADAVDGMAEPDEEALQIEVTALRDRTAFHMNEVQRQHAPMHELVQVKTQRGNVLGQVRGRLFERHEHARLAKTHSAMDQELHAQQCLAASGATTDERGAPQGHTATGQLVEALDAGGGFGKLKGKHVSPG